MIKNQKKYQQRLEQEKMRDLRKLSLRDGIKRLEELLACFDYFNKKKRKQPLPLSLSRLLKQTHKPS